MKKRTKEFAALAAVIGLSWMTLTWRVLAEVRDYEFGLLQSEIKKSDGAIVAVRLVNKKTGAAAPDAAIWGRA